VIVLPRLAPVLIAILGLGILAGGASGNDKPVANLHPIEFLRMLEKIGVHGDLRDVAFTEETLHTHFTHKGNWRPYEGEQVLSEVEYRPYGSFLFGNSASFRYGYDTGMIPRIYAGNQRNLAYMQFWNIVDELCIKWPDMKKVFDGKYANDEDFGMRVPPRYGYRLFSNKTFYIAVVVVPAAKEADQCIPNIELGQSTLPTSIR